MNPSEMCIRRPVMTTLIMAAIVLFGFFAYRLLPVAELPSVDFPTIEISASLPGANPETMASRHRSRTNSLVSPASRR
jgi:hydrophobic/amphiphilic exporter-1 (mainly G- bacteria), HAE1 family